MFRILVLLLTLALGVFPATAQYDADYIRQHAVRIEKPEGLSDSIYNLLAPFKLILFGEMHGTNESTPFVLGMAKGIVYRLDWKFLPLR